MLRLAILFSGTGSNANALRNFYFEKTKRQALLITNNKESPLAIEAKIIAAKNNEADLLEILKREKINWIFLAGYMRVLSKDFIDHYSDMVGTKNRIVNIHPSYLPDLKGKDAYLKAWDSDREETGISLHYVTPEVDSGEIIEQLKIPIERDLSFTDWVNKAKKSEHSLYLKFLDSILLGDNNAAL